MFWLEIVIAEEPELVNVTGTSADPPTVTFPKATLQELQTSCDDAVCADATAENTVGMLTRAANKTKAKGRAGLLWGRVRITCPVSDGVG